MFYLAETGARPSSCACRVAAPNSSSAAQAMAPISKGLEGLVGHRVGGQNDHCREYRVAGEEIQRSEKPIQLLTTSVPTAFARRSPYWKSSKR